MESSSQASKLKRTATLFGMFNRHNEGMIEAADSFESTYNDLVSKVGDEKAREAGAKAAQATYLGNLPLMALDILQFRAMTFNPISGKTSGGLVENALSKIPNAKLASAIGKTAGVLSEGAEEYWQALVQEESKHYADNIAGVGDKNSTFSQRFKEFNSKGETWNATVLGIFGGLLLGGISSGLGRISNSQSQKDLDKSYQNFITTTTGMGIDMANDIKVAQPVGLRK